MQFKAFYKAFNVNRHNIKTNTDKTLITPIKYQLIDSNLAQNCISYINIMRRPHKTGNKAPDAPNRSEDALQSAQYRRYLREQLEVELGHYRD